MVIAKHYLSASRRLADDIGWWTRFSQSVICALPLALMLASGSARASDDTLPTPLAPYAGKIVYVDFWASWCGPCAQSFPWLNQMQAKYGKQLAIVAVNLDAQSGDAQTFLGRHPAQFDIVYDARGQLAERYHIDGMPSTVILDAGGRVIHQHSGFRSAQAADYEAAIRKAINMPAASTGGSP
ncbi:MAG: thiol:disulfide interchange protein DsbE [Nevskia sp.]|nr:thiol:disulfide interchange protein DsbE [Nevskia sp.]